MMYDVVYSCNIFCTHLYQIVLVGRCSADPEMCWLFSEYIYVSYIVHVQSYTYSSNISTQYE